ncbi:MAG: isocitrate dehydrogenase kinase/phosphatase-domain containing protein [Myxococcota bacterium]
MTRNGRVVFYDYDELILLSECNFRRMPPPRDEFDEMASEPWYVVAENDIFPAELRTFIGVPREWMADFEAHHADLFTPEFWWSLQTEVAASKGPEVQPFRTRCLL